MTSTQATAGQPLSSWWKILAIGTMLFGFAVLIGLTAEEKAAWAGLTGGAERAEFVEKFWERDKVCTLLGHPRTCPHGRLIPEGECCRRAKAGTPSSPPLTHIHL